MFSPKMECKLFLNLRGVIMVSISRPVLGDSDLCPSPALNYHSLCLSPTLPNTFENRRCTRKCLGLVLPTQSYHYDTGRQELVRDRTAFRPHKTISRRSPWNSCVKLSMIHIFWHINRCKSRLQATVFGLSEPEAPPRRPVRPHTWMYLQQGCSNFHATGQF